MKTNKLLLVVLFVMLISSVNGWCQESASDKDTSGKIIGRIFDEETNLPVSEVFKVLLVDCSNIINSKSTVVKHDKSNSRGIFVFNKVKPGIYCIVFLPLAGRTIYCFEPALDHSPEIKHIVKIIPGQITRIEHKARRGGNLKVILVDKNGNTISPRSVMPPSPYQDFPNDELRRLHLRLYSLDFLYENSDNFVSYNSFSDDYLDDGEITLSGLFPGKYKFDVDLRYLGYGWPLSFTNILIKKGQITELNVLVDFTDNTGIEGIVIDQNSTPINGALVSLTGTNEENYFYGSIRTNQNGFYKIVGLKEGLYSLDVSLPLNIESPQIDHFPSQNVRIVKNVIKTKNIVFEKTVN